MKYRHVDTIDFSVCDLIVENKLFYDPIEDMYYKLWKEGAIVWDRKIGDLFLLAVYSGFYDNLAEIESVLISDNSSCIGYAMKSCRCPMKDTGGIIQGDILRHKNRHDFNIFDNASEQSDKYQRFLKTLIDNAERTGIFFYDLVQSNVSDLGNFNHQTLDKYGIIDLESVAHIRDLYKIPKYHLECIPEDYYEFLQDLHKRKITIYYSGIDMKLIEQAWSMSTGGIGCKPYYSIVINGRSFEGERAWELRWKKFSEAIDWDHKRILDLGTCMGVVPAFLLKYTNIESATAIDFNPHHIKATELVRKAFRIPEEKMKIVNIDFSVSAYEEILGYDYDVVFCLSFFRWMKDKDRFLRYLSNFKTIVFEAHDLDGDIVTTFKNIGFTNKVLGDTVIGRSFSESKKRTMYIFEKHI